MFQRTILPFAAHSMYSGKKMNTKVIVTLVIVGVLAIAVVGMVSAQISTSSPNGVVNGAVNRGFFGWMGRCFGFREAQYGTGTSTFQGQPTNITVKNPNTGTTTTYQGYTGYSGCMGFRP